jgi:membrane associated rhomboid family serine protease
VLPLKDFVPTRRPAVVTGALIVANLAIYVWEQGAGEREVDRYAYYPCAVEGPCTGIAAVHHQPAWEGAFSSMFLHASWLHVLGNMLFLWIFGNNVEDALGRLRFLVWYLAAGLVATFTQTFVTLHYAGAAAASVPNVGASGAIAGVLGAYLVLLPTAAVLTLIGIFPVPVPAFLFLGIWFVLQLYAGGMGVTHPDSGGGVAFFAHVGGFVFGALTIRLLARYPPGRVRTR